MTHHIPNVRRLVVAGLLLHGVEVLDAGPGGLPAAGHRVAAVGAGVAIPGPGPRPSAVPSGFLFLLPGLLNLGEISHARRFARSSELRINLCCVILLSLRIPFLRTFGRTAGFSKRFKTNVKSVVYIFNPLLVSPVGGRGGGGGESSAGGRGLRPGEELRVLLTHGVRPGEPASWSVAVHHRVPEVILVKDIL